MLEGKTKLYKEDEKGKYVIAGVCAGISQHMGWPLWLVRLLAVISGLIFGIGVMAYAMAMVIIPDKTDVLGSDKPGGGYKKSDVRHGKF